VLHRFGRKRKDQEERSHRANFRIGKEDKSFPVLPGQRDFCPDHFGRARALPQLEVDAHPEGLPQRFLKDKHNNHLFFRAIGLLRNPVDNPFRSACKEDKKQTEIGQRSPFRLGHNLKP
jgi:hypothetical protein